ncbi:probable DNA-3-methyladenine glycosylase 2 [Cucurbita maxima]|uniref:Probable DNA-3-methyladenine glycosylase 2 n=1 Tax=Cucurbita maxima TaxID=3661 RepID=A0A6J1IIA5_CUCMA|nr:probable DNA-3-methyladenine glycosylase 2 [Cucurbita maxima]
MGEHTQVQVQTQTQSQSQAQSQAQNTFHESSNSTTTIAQATVSLSEVMNAPSQTSSPPSKMPLRPRKIRKLSPDESDPNSSQVVAIPDGPKPIATSKSNKSKTAQQRAAFASAPVMLARSLSCEGEVEVALRHLRNADPLLAPLIDLHQRPTFDSFQTPFLALTRSILYQQLAYKAGTSIYTRFIALCGGEAGVLPETVLALSPQQLRQIGISGRKSSYLHDLARKYQNGILSDPAIVNMDDKSLFTMLTMVNGIGSWSVHMFMIFSLHRPDVLPINDLNVRKGVQLLYNLEELPRPSQMDHLCEKWRPYRSVGSWYMWRFAEAKGASSSAAAIAAGASLQLQQQEHQPEHQHQQQPQLLDPLNSILNLGACAWGQ